MATRPGRNEPREIVDMTVGVIVQQARRPARSLARSRGRAAASLPTCVAGQRVAVGVEQALLGGDDRARSVAVDRAAFQHPVRLGEWAVPAAPGEPFADVLVAIKIVFAAPAIEAEALRRGASAPLPSTIGPVSRSQISPNGSTITSAKGASLRALSAAPSWAATSRTVSPLPPAWTASAKAATSRSRLLEIAKPQLGIARKTDPHGFVRRPFREGWRRIGSHGGRR